MAEETSKPLDPNKTTPPTIEPPKDIEDLLKELPKVEAKPRTSPIPPPSAPLKPPPLPPREPPKPPQLPPPTKPSVPSAPPPPGGEEKFKSFMRTMEQDISALKGGMKPESKPLEIKPPIEIYKPPPPPMAAPKMPPPEIKLGPPERAKPFEIPAPLPQREPEIMPPAVLLPPRPKRISSGLLIAILVILVAAAAAWFFLIRQPEKEIVITIPTQTPTPLPPSFQEIFGSPTPITISSTGNFLNTLKNSVAGLSLISGHIIPLEIIDENGSEYSLSQIFGKLQIDLPGGLVENLDIDEWSFVVFGQSEFFDQNGNLIMSGTPTVAPRINLVAKTDNPDSLRSSMNSWEVTMTEDLKALFSLKTTKTTSEFFLDNFYGGADIRYRNFPFADSTIDYTLLNLFKYDTTYLILTSSRESIYKIIDLLQSK